jgi:cell division protein FtsB
VPVDEAPGGITEEELRALQAEEAALLAANARLQQEVAQLEAEVKGLL